MRFPNRLRDLYLIMLAETLTDLAGILDEIRAEHDHDREMLCGMEAAVGAGRAGDQPGNRAEVLGRPTAVDERTAA
jgi:hypothetical protein